jgi:hypothetical protein
MSTVIDNSSIFSFTASTTAQSQTYKVGSYDSVCYQINATDATPGAKTFVAADVATNVGNPASSIHLPAHGYFTGLKVALSGTNLPTGLSATNYWIIVDDANYVSLADSLAHASAGTKVAITGAGTTADAALTPASLSQVVKLQQSNDGVTFFDVATVTQTITGTAQYLWLVTNPPALWHKFVVTPTTGALTLAVITCSRNNTILSHGAF